MLWKFNSVYNPKLQLADHEQLVKYEMTLPPDPQASVNPKLLYITRQARTHGRAIDDATEEFVEESRTGAA